ncbi:MAG: biotin transporter BioY [Christensenellaceae bacterium]|nr:biotin transporter BioY [Christensenellaceae bacterium]MBS6564924.1 biotin transporter BioY [Clostridiales bacterium]PWL99456.1 MAG: biotin transporter BioY [Selenomonadales bacterium]
MRNAAWLSGLRTAALKNYPRAKSASDCTEGDKNLKVSTLRNMILCALFAALIAVGAFIKIPVPVVPFTLQYLFTMLSGLMLGSKWGLAAVGIYIALGLAGLPVFAQGGGIGYVLQPSFGYIIGFALGAFVTGLIAQKKRRPSLARLLAASFAGLFLVYFIGMLYYYLISKFYLNTPIGLWPLFLYCFILAVPGDIILSVLGAVLAKRIDIRKINGSAGND